MKKISILLLALSLPLFARADTAGTTIRIKHSVTNISSTTPVQIFGTLAKSSHRLEVENSSLSGTLVLITGCNGASNGAYFRNVLFIQPAVSKNVPLSVGKNDCLSAAGADGTVSTGNSTYTVFFDE